MQLMTLPAYRPGTPLDFAPINDAMDANQRNALARAAQAMQERQVGIQESQFQLTKRDSDRQNAMAMAREAEFQRFLQNPGAIKDPATLAAIRLGGADQAGSMIMQGRNADMQRQQMDLQARVTRAQLEQTKMQTPEWRQQNAARFGIDPNSEAGRAWVVTGNFSPPGPMDEFMRGIARQMATGQGGAGQQAPAPQPQPQPRVMPQSNEGPTPADPMLIPTQAAAPGAAPAPAPQGRAAPPVLDTPIGPMTEQQARLAGLAFAASGRGEAGKMINEWADRDKLGKEAANENDKRELAAVEGLSRLRLIAQGFKPEWLTYENKAKQYGISWADSFETTRKKLRPEDLQNHVEYTMFVRDAMSNLTQGIKEATGAAMGVQEEARIRAGLPDPAKDGPTQFQAKLAGTVRELEFTIARTRFLRANGFRGQPWRGTGADAERALPLGDFRRIINQDGEAMGRQLRQANPNASEQEIQGFVRNELRTKYGIGI